RGARRARGSRRTRSVHPCAWRWRAWPTGRAAPWLPPAWPRSGLAGSSFSGSLHSTATACPRDAASGGAAPRPQRGPCEAPDVPPRLGGAAAPLASPRRAFLSREMQEADLRAHVLFKAQQAQDILSSPSSGPGRQRYFANASANRPYELELDRWNHEARPAGSGEDADDDEEEASGRAAFEQLSCLTGRYLSAARAAA
ncbi:unnamed protein product, partial [Prorocentrum cordatum]